MSSKTHFPPLTRRESISIVKHALGIWWTYIGSISNHVISYNTMIESCITDYLVWRYSSLWWLAGVLCALSSANACSSSSLSSHSLCTTACSAEICIMQEHACTLQASTDALPMLHKVPIIGSASDTSYQLQLHLNYWQLSLTLDLALWLVES